MGPIWGRQDPGGPHIGPMNFAIWEGFLTWLLVQPPANLKPDFRILVTRGLATPEVSRSSGLHEYLFIAHTYAFCIFYFYHIIYVIAILTLFSLFFRFFGFLHQFFMFVHASHHNVHLRVQLPCVLGRRCHHHWYEMCVCVCLRKIIYH